MINKAILIGNLGAAPEIRHTQAGDPVATFSLATTEVWRKPDGNKHEQTEWHRIVAFKRMAEVCGELLEKGTRVYIEGRIQTRKWQDQDGEDHWATEIVVRDMKKLTPKNADRAVPPSMDSNVPLPEPPVGDDVPF
ncbi:single-stranded DNA-binding protein [Desulfurivibrio sp. D14AmB]|uniref:single-stranded DNA-binding protein n=1 Tax=Desulfurivibrio sp. D14AmB TaxID=3374370 RepID=UPI00376EF15D